MGPRKFIREFTAYMIPNRYNVCAAHEGSATGRGGGLDGVGGGSARPDRAFRRPTAGCFVAYGAPSSRYRSSADKRIIQLASFSSHHPVSTVSTHAAARASGAICVDSDITTVERHAGCPSTAARAVRWNSASRPGQRIIQSASSSTHHPVRARVVRRDSSVALGGGFAAVGRRAGCSNAAAPARRQHSATWRIIQFASSSTHPPTRTRVVRRDSSTALGDFYGGRRAVDRPHRPGFALSAVATPTSTSCRITQPAWQ